MTQAEQDKADLIQRLKDAVAQKKQELADAQTKLKNSQEAETQAEEKQEAANKALAVAQAKEQEKKDAAAEAKKTEAEAQKLRDEVKAALDKTIETLSQCKEDLEAADKLYKSLVVTDLTAELAKKLYKPGDKVDTAGLKVMVKRADGSEEQLTAEDYSLKLPEIPAEWEGEDLDLTLEVTYLGKTIALNLTVEGTPAGGSEEPTPSADNLPTEPAATGSGTVAPAAQSATQPAAQPVTEAAAPPAGPAMGDDSQLGWWMATALLSLMGLAVLNLKKTR